MELPLRIDSKIRYNCHREERSEPKLRAKRGGTKPSRRACFAALAMTCFSENLTALLLGGGGVGLSARAMKMIGQHEELLVVRQGGKVERVDTLNLGFPIGMVEEIARWVYEATVTFYSITFSIISDFKVI